MLVLEGYIIRLVIGIIIELISAMFLLGMVISNYKDPDPLGVTIAGSIFIVIIMISGGLLIYFGIKKFSTRQKVLNIAMKTFRENGSINYTKIQQELNVNEYKARKYILWGYRKNLFFKISQNGINQPKDLLN